MAVSFIHGSEINLELEYLIQEAEEYLYLICPYIKLHDRLKKELVVKKDQPKLKIILVFGKNEEGLHKSLSKEDFEFLQSLPNIEIKYEPLLHAKYYASESKAIITSMNLHEYSQNNNIEAGVVMDVKGVFATLGNSIIKTDDPETEAYTYFGKVIKNATSKFLKEPEFKKTNFGLSSVYEKSVVKINLMEDLYDGVSKKSISYQPIETVRVKRVGYCIRTGAEISFDLRQPFTYKAFKSWQSFGNPNYAEKYCHFSGEESFGETSFGSPILKKHWKDAKEKFRF